MEQKLIKNSVIINASKDKVWNALVNPEETKKYMFGCETISDWKVGSSLIWKMMHEGKEFIPVTGFIIDIIPGKKLTYSVFDPHSTMEDIPQNYLHVTYELSTENNETILNVTQGDYSTVAEGERRYQEAYNNGEGWNPIMVKIKEVAEAN
jgi:uncharacterized protein YndB with AHSA1/START domain